MRDVHFYGDINWMEYGGVFIGKAFSEEDERLYPNLKNTYHVLNVCTGADDNGLYASFCQLDLDDWIDACKEFNVSLVNSPYEAINTLISYMGTKEFDDISFSHQYPQELADYRVTMSDLIDWMSTMGLEAYASKYISQIAYKKYKRDWFENHVSIHLLHETKNNYLSYKQDCDELGFESDTFSEYIEENGFGGMLWVCFDEFLNAEYADKGYMEALLTSEQYKAYQLDMEEK